MAALAAVSAKKVSPRFLAMNSSYLLSFLRINGATKSGGGVMSTLTNHSFLVRPICNSRLLNLTPADPHKQQRRSTSFFNKVTADALWKGVTGVSNAGRKRGRGKGVGKKMAKDLNKGQVIGMGGSNMVWPGLNAPILQGKEIVERRQLPPDPERSAKLVKMRDEMGAFRPLRLNPIERGWSGTKMPGRRVGPPDPVDGDAFDGFDSIVLEMKSVFNMKGNFGRKRRLSVLVVAGNGHGMAGFAVGKANDGRTALRMAKNKTGQRLMFIERCDEHTVCHDFFCQFGRTKIFVSQKPEGYGLICHRAIKNICQLVGIKDIHCKVEGALNLQHIVKAFFLGLLQQKTHQKLADEKRLYLVEKKLENDNFPKVIAAPTTPCRTSAELEPQEVLDFTQYSMDGKVRLHKKKLPPFYEKLPGWANHVKKTERFRNHPQVRVEMLAQYGEVRSFLAEKYPECRAVNFEKKVEED